MQTYLRIGRGGGAVADAEGGFVGVHQVALTVVQSMPVEVICEPRGNRQLLLPWLAEGNKRITLLIDFFGFFGYENFRNFIFWPQAFANLHGKRRQGKFIWKTRIYMLQTCKHDTTKLIFQKVLIF